MDKISERAVTKIVAAAVASVPGTATIKSGVGRLTGRAFPRFDVQLDDDGDTATIEAFIAVTWPAPLLDVAETVRDTIVEHVHTLTGIKVLACNVVVGPVVAGEGRVLVEDLALPPLVTTPITVRGIR
ncbi:Asp23/Gls24 family envelope stress response protein [Corynebacterium hindlerae]|uniref:Asp23/Gls24 family envelope stress response protein n=1 Tax=Corynebacterium hindlerae TaxID=699041 RepID=A0A7G5FHS5_9CORY|nr:Asp23/Gls24 family envelope stress response protein [Corynebacterium hindlerae]QMV86166.1 Asp23/Gls24 family envelope stress response protein [Corynebacterium hindlerae]